MLASRHLDESRRDVARLSAEKTTAKTSYEIPKIGPHAASIARKCGTLNSYGNPLNPEITRDAAAARNDRARTIRITWNGNRHAATLHRIILAIDVERSPEDRERKSKECRTDEAHLSRVNIYSAAPLSH
ncbi:MAG TPA: hypothetical protein VII75_15270 [Thermoanaerobaculia bacterium]